MRYFIEIAYKGTYYNGWQIQPNAKSVQETIEKSISIILSKKITIFGAGRTDTGVHAKQMFAHFDFENFLPENIVYRLNRFLPKDIAILNIKRVKEDAHARFNAYSRTYTYYISTQKNPFSVETKWQIKNQTNLDLIKMNAAASFLIETKDFTSFSKLHSDNKTNFCHVTFAEWSLKENEFIFTITANRFLRNMVRAIVGTLVEVGKNLLTLEDFINFINNKHRNLASYTAPAEGLFLTHILYPKDIFINEIK
ncbi:MAG: tRNA pseudouridine(38-40) synthase TruA [Solirubrobacteraceae bacterium]